MIYILDNDPALAAQMLDDKSLDTQIRDIAQVLCNVHIMVIYSIRTDNILERGARINKLPLLFKYSNQYNEWTHWARECRANYLYLVELGAMCSNEYCFRYEDRSGLVKLNKYHLAIIWAGDNVPDLPECPHGYCKQDKYSDFFGTINFQTNIPIYCKDKYSLSNLPLVMPKKYIRNYIFRELLDSGSIPEHILSYRNFYRAKFIRQYSKDYFIIGHNEEHCGGTWTNRDKPEWLKL